MLCARATHWAGCACRRVPATAFPRLSRPTLCPTLRSPFMQASSGARASSANISRPRLPCARHRMPQAGAARPVQVAARAAASQASCPSRLPQRINRRRSTTQLPAAVAAAAAAARRECQVSRPAKRARASTDPGLVRLLSPAVHPRFHRVPPLKTAGSSRPSWTWTARAAVQLSNATPGVASPWCRELSQTAGPQGVYAHTERAIESQ